MEFTPLTVIAGVNASGKSNLFDAFSLLSRLAETDLKTAFSEQRGNPQELFTLYGGEYASEMEFVVEMHLEKLIKDSLGGTYTLKHTRLRYELKIRRAKDEFGFDSIFLDTEKLMPLSNKNNKVELPYISTEDSTSFPWITIRDSRNGQKEFLSSDASQTSLSNINSVDFPHVFCSYSATTTFNR